MLVITRFLFFGLILCFASGYIPANASEQNYSIPISGGIFFPPGWYGNGFYPHGYYCPTENLPQHNFGVPMQKGTLYLPTIQASFPPSPTFWQRGSSPSLSRKNERYKPPKKVNQWPLILAKTCQNQKRKVKNYKEDAETSPLNTIDLLIRMALFMKTSELERRPEFVRSTTNIEKDALKKLVDDGQAKLLVRHGTGGLLEIIRETKKEIEYNLT